MRRFQCFLFFSFCFVTHTLFGAISAGTTASDLDAALHLLSQMPGGGVIDFDLGNVVLSDQVRALQSDEFFTFIPNINVTINGLGNTLDGSASNKSRGFFTGGRNADGTGLITINSLHFAYCTARGGNGGISGGAGGLGAGGGLFVGENTNVVLRNCTFSNCTAKGGNGATNNTNNGGGGGGMRGNGGSSQNRQGGGGAGGFGGNGANAAVDGGGGGGSSGFSIGNASSRNAGQTFGGNGSNGGSGVGGDGGSAARGDTAGFGGGGGGGGSGFQGGDSVFGGGGGGSGSSSTLRNSSRKLSHKLKGAAASFGGGGGGGSAASFNGGNGGFGGGGGGGSGGGTTGGTGGFGGGNGDANISGGFAGKGAGFGGAIFIQSNGNLTLITTNSFTGSLFSNNSAAAGDSGNASTDPNANGGALGQDIFMMSSGSLTFNLAKDVSMSSAIQGDIGAGQGNQTIGGLTKQGTARLTLTGDNTYTGTTTISGGELRLNGSVISEIVIKAGATLSGYFSALKRGTNPASGNVINSGRLTLGLPGDSSGRSIIEGNFTNEPTGTLAVDITPAGNHDKIFLSGNAVINGGQLEVYVGSGNYIAGTQYEVIAGSVSGAFDNQDNPTQVGPNAGNVKIGVSIGSLILTILSNQLFANQSIDSGVPQDVVDCIRSATIIAGSDFATIVEILGTLSNSEVNAALTSLSAIRFGSLEWINARNNSYIADILSQHLFELCCSPRNCHCNYCCHSQCNTSAWISVFGNLMDNKKRIKNLLRYNANATGAILGIDTYLGSCFYYGAATGYVYTDLLWRNNGGDGKVQSYFGALYSSFLWDCLSIDCSFIGGASENHTKRNLIFSSIYRKAKGNFWSYFFTGHLGLTAYWKEECLVLEPFALADYHYYTHKSFKEKKANSLNLNVKSKTQEILRAESGIKCYYEVDCDEYCYAPYLGLSWIGEFPLYKSKQPASFTGQSCVIRALSYGSSRLSFVSPQAGIKWTNCDGNSFIFGYKGIYNKKIYINEVEGRFEWIF